MKKIERKIERLKIKLIENVKENGLYENFGQKEVRKLRDKYIDISLYNHEMNEIRRIISEFDEWCMSYGGN